MTQDLPAAPIVERYDEIKAEIARAAKRAHRNADEINFMAVAKNTQWHDIEPLLARGHRLFGENRVQEAARKWQGYKKRSEIELHLIGALQSNKAKEACALFDVIETLDRPRLAAALARVREQDQATRLPRLFVQVNTGEEAQKGGVLPNEADAFIALCRTQYGLTIEGLMCLPPLNAPAALHFALLGEIARRNKIDCLSMGMSADFTIAIEMGAHIIRIGSGLFGARQ